MFLQDLLNHIYSLVPLQDAARAACVSRRFLLSWRHYPNLIFNVKTLGLNGTKLGFNDETSGYFSNTVDRILKNHSGIGMETFRLQLYPRANIDAHCLDSWIQLAINSGIKELALELSLHMKTEYNHYSSAPHHRRFKNVITAGFGWCWI